LETNICAVCGQELVLQQDEDDDGPEKTYKLSCGHLYPQLILTSSSDGNSLQKVDVPYTC